MHKKNISRFSIVSVAVLLLVFIVSLFSLPMSSAVSATTTGLVTDGFDRNLGKYASTDDYEVYAFDNELVFYDKAANLVKTWAIPTTLTAQTLILMQGANPTSLTNITSFTVHNRHTVILAPSYTDDIIVATAYVAHAKFYASVYCVAYPTVLEYFCLSPSNLAYTSNCTLFDQPSSQNKITYAYNTQTYSADNICISDLTIWEDDASNVFVAVGSESTTSPTYSGSANKLWVCQVDDTYAVNSITTGSDQILFGSTGAFYIGDDLAAVLTKNDVFGTQFKLWWIDTDAGTATYGGVTGIADTAGEYWSYYGGFLAHEITATNYVVDVLVGFGYQSGGYDALKVELLRFNSTSFGVAASVASSLEMYGSFPRVISVGSTDLTSFDALVDSANYGAVYLNNIGALYQYLFELSDLETTSPSLTGSGLSIYQGLVFLFGGSDNAGALVDPFSTVGVMVDYTGERCAATTVTPLSTTISYSYVITPTPIYESTNFAQLGASATYTYRGTIQVNGVGGAGSVRIQDTQTPSNFVIKPIVGGNFNFYLYTSAVAQEFYYDINITLTNFSGNYLTTLHIISVSGTSGGGTPTPIPTGVPGGGGNLNPTEIKLGMTSFINFMVLFLCIGAPALLLGVMAGAPGLIGGAILGLGIGVIAGLVPFWFIFLVGVAAVLMLTMWNRKPDGE